MSTEIVTLTISTYPLPVTADYILCFYILFQRLMTCLQFGQEWVTSLQPSTQNGIRQHGQHLKKNYLFVIKVYFKHLIKKIKMLKMLM